MPKEIHVHVKRTKDAPVDPAYQKKLERAAVQAERSAEEIERKRAIIERAADLYRRAANEYRNGNGGAGERYEAAGANAEARLGGR